MLGRASKKDKSSDGRKKEGQDNLKKVKDDSAVKEMNILKKKFKYLEQKCNASFKFHQPPIILTWKSL